MGFPNAVQSGWAWDESYKAENDLSSYQYHAVERSTEDYVDLVDGASDIAIGILQNDPTADQIATVRLLGMSIAVVDGNSVNIAIGDSLTIEPTNGHLVKATSGDRCLARAEEAATADGAKITVRLTGEFYEP